MKYPPLKLPCKECDMQIKELSGNMKGNISGI